MLYYTILKCKHICAEGLILNARADREREREIQ